MKFTDNFKNLIEEKGFTQKEIAKRLNTTQQTISRWINGQNQPDLNLLFQISKILECSTDYLLGIEDDYGIIRTESTLSINEEQIISLYRKLNERDQHKVLGFIQALAY